MYISMSFICSIIPKMVMNICLVLSVLSSFVSSLYLYAAVEVEFDPTTYTVTEGDIATITIVLRGMTSQSISVDFATQDLTAVGTNGFYVYREPRLKQPYRKPV